MNSRYGVRGTLIHLQHLHRDNYIMIKTKVLITNFIIKNEKSIYSFSKVGKKVLRHFKILNNFESNKP